jgi:hypothetical protein
MLSTAERSETVEGLVVHERTQTDNVDCMLKSTTDFLWASDSGTSVG